MILLARCLLVGLALLSGGFAQEGSWQSNCTPQAKECRSVWITLTLPSSSSTLLIAYDAVRNKRGSFDASITVNLNGILLAPEQNAVSLSGENESISIPITAKDDSGITAQFTNLSAVSQVLSVLSNNKTIQVSFLALNASTITTIKVPMNNFNELLARIPHGNTLFEVSR